MERTATAPVAVRVSVVAVEEGGASSMSISVDMVRVGEIKSGRSGGCDFNGKIEAA